MTAQSKFLDDIKNFEEYFKNSPKQFMQADVFPSVETMGAKNLFKVLVLFDGETEAIECDGYFIYECGVSFWNLSNAYDNPKNAHYSIIGWRRI